jgi:hypothetical protein
MVTRKKTSFGTVRLVALGGVFCLAAAGCATQDRTGAQASIAVANAAITDAAAADANRYAGGDIQAARSALGEAVAAMNASEYDRARLLALRAEADANLARARTGSAKAQVAANELNESTRLLRNELGRARQ